MQHYLVDFAKAHGLEYHQDELYNVIIIKEASAGCEGREPLILQGHMDMVAEQTPDCTKDMEKENSISYKRVPQHCAECITPYQKDIISFFSPSSTTSFQKYIVFIIIYNFIIF